MSAAPRVLLLTNNKLHPYMGGGVLLTNLFSRFPRQNLFCVDGEGSEEGAPDAHQYSLRRGDLRPGWLAAGRLLVRIVAGLIRGGGRLRRADWKTLAIQSCDFHLPRRIDEEIRRFAPDVIYAWAGDALFARLIKRCIDRYRVPCVVHFMDNQIELEGENALQRAMHAAYRHDLSQLMSHVSRIFTISNAMGTAYQKRFGRPCDVFHGLMDRESWPWPPASAPAGEFSLVFTGSIESGQMGGLRDVAAAVDGLAGKGRKVRLVLYLSELYEQRARPAFSGFKNIHYVRHPAATSGLRAVLNQADLLVLAYGFDGRCQQYYRYSFATKTVAYMLSGRCILAYGPSGIEPIAYIERGGYGHVVLEEGSRALEEALEVLMDDAGRREEIARRAYQAGVEEHDLGPNAERFLATMRSIAGRA